MLREGQMLQVWGDWPRCRALQQAIRVKLLQLWEVGSPGQGVHHRSHGLAPPPDHAHHPLSSLSFFLFYSL
ncbi:hypothetical protein LDENG_00221210 [Lucifuga dentata]|nr:hypothetical protein LDENG_00221210 [Lucifuga dentata]